METINLTEEQRAELIIGLSRLVYELRKEPCVDCIYFAPFVNEENNNKFLSFTVVCDYSKGEFREAEYDELIGKTEDICGNLDLKLVFDIDSRDRYTLIAMHKREIIRNRELYNSSILFDREGYYSKIKAYEESREETRYVYKYSNLLGINPPIDDTLLAIIDTQTSNNSDVNVLRRENKDNK